jgi:hypothetical protein
MRGAGNQRSLKAVEKTLFYCNTSTSSLPSELFLMMRGKFSTFLKSNLASFSGKVEARINFTEVNIWISQTQEG